MSPRILGYIDIFIAILLSLKISLSLKKAGGNNIFLATSQFSSNSVLTILSIYLNIPNIVLISC
jgi:hypothetical protein